MAKKVKAEAAAAPGNTFELEGKKYNVNKGARVPLANGAQVMTAADICISEEAQIYLVKNKCGCIEEVIE